MDLNLSIVIIGKNEGDNLDRCIKSVFHAVEGHINYEIIYVDSNSNDNSVEIALRNKIQVYVIKDSDLYSASLGRYIGALKSNMNYILFIDGDMELIKGWVEVAIKSIKDNYMYAGVKGILDNYYIDNTGNIIKVSKNANQIFECQDADYFGGAVLLKRKDLIDAGNYALSIIANEEAELYSRILKNGKKVLEIPEKMVKHYTPYIKAQVRQFNILFSKRNLGAGQGFMNAINKKSIPSFVKKFKYLFLSILIDSMSIIFFIMLILTKNIRLFIPILIMQITILLINGFKRKWYWYFLDKISEMYFIPGMLSYRRKINYECIEL